MSLYLGIDTSNYRTSAAVFDSEKATWKNSGRLLDVPEGSIGLRQSDALFQHVVHLPERIAQLPGRILILRGNHDYWWSSLTQLRCSLPQGMHAVQNDAYDAGDMVFCGTRGWAIPGQGAAAQDEKIFRREVLRLEMSLKAARQAADGRPIVAMMHYPPLLPEHKASGTAFTKLLSAYGVSRCVYGHLHGQSIQRGINGVYDGVRYDLVSCDALGFAVKEVTP